MPISLLLNMSMKGVSAPQLLTLLPLVILIFHIGTTASGGADITSTQSTIRYFDFHVKYTNFSRLCHTKRMVTVNDEFPGPIIEVDEGDRVLVNVTNDMPDKNITIHWHGIRQLRMAWFDGPAYVTQCPIRPGHSFLYNFTITGQRGTLLWHAHITWMRSTVHGAIIIRPKAPQAYPFPEPAKDIPLVLGEWWNTDTEKVISQALQSGAGPNVSDAYTINGQPGSLYNCSIRDTFKLKVEQNRTYLLRIINAALNDELFLSIANHTLTVVEIDASYTKPLKTDTILIAPGQTTNALLTTDQPIGSYILAVRPYDSAGPSVPFDNTTATAMVIYEGATDASKAVMPSLPAYNDTPLANNLSSSLRSLNSDKFPARVPKSVDRNLLFTAGLARKPCPRGKRCQGPSGGRFAAAMNNISFTLPKTALLQSFFSPSALSHSTVNPDGGNVVFPTNFPDKPTRVFNFTGPVQPKNLRPQEGTRLSWIPFNASVQLVFQGTNILGTESHPIHIHGYNFFVVGQGTGNFNMSTDPAKFNLVDPPERNTIGVPKGGWAAVRFQANNPGVWFMHCHLEVHTSWGLETAFLVTNGKTREQSLEAPPLDLPVC
ncbi:hypothetical protein KP509_04G058400 [Ceratopteris richardii]|uniref:Laccase n=1 Tax=Ceratopteris richardii TaxID=49495 RepID=A0A8T2V0R3_CERRI|nr:hypothetical protein KP509_04G058400 [Ceratopteris richardii]